MPKKQRLMCTSTRKVQRAKDPKVKKTNQRPKRLRYQKTKDPKVCPELIMLVSQCPKVCDELIKLLRLGGSEKDQFLIRKDKNPKYPVSKPKYPHYSRSGLWAPPPPHVQQFSSTTNCKFPNYIYKLKVTRLPFDLN